MDKAPDAFRTISEVADEIDVPQHVLRFWESRFHDIKPMKRGGGRRYYRPDDIDLLRGIRHLLYGEGYTIRGVQRILREQGLQFVQTVWEEGAEQPQAPSADEVAAPAEVAAADDRLAARGRPPEPPPPIDQRRQASPAERREPTFAAPVPAERTRQGDRADHPQPALAAADRLVLQAALDDLIECRRLLDAALEEQP